MSKHMSHHQLSDQQIEQCQKLYDFQKNFLEHIIQDKDYQFKNQPHGEIKKAKLQKYLDIYKNNFYSGIINSLQAVFPACHKLLPDNVFKGLSVSLIRSAEAGSIKSPTHLSLQFPQTLVDYEITSEIPFIKELADYELAKYQFIKSAEQSMYYTSKHPVQDLTSSILKNTKLKASKETAYFYRLLKKEDYLQVTKISKKMYLDKKTD